MFESAIHANFLLLDREIGLAFRAPVDPLAPSAVLVDADAAGQVSVVREVRHDQRDVADLRDHRIVSVRLALAEAAGMRVHVGNDLQTPATADSQQYPSWSRRRG